MFMYNKSNNNNKSNTKLKIKKGIKKSKQFKSVNYNGFRLYLHKFNKSILKMNNSKYFAGICMIILNIGSKFISLRLSRTQEEYFKSSIARVFLLFSVAWIDTRDIYTSFILTILFLIMTEYIFNERSKFCVLPKQLNKIKQSLDTNNDNVISDEEIENALNILNKAKNISNKNTNE